MSPATMARRTEERVWSYLWDCSDEEWAAHAEPAIAAFRALPDQDRPRGSSVRHAYRVYTRA